MLLTLYKIGEVHFRLLGTNGFHAKAQIEKFTAAGSRCRQNLKYENFTSSFGRLRQNIAQKACRMCSTITFPLSTNQIIHLWRCRCRCCRHFLNCSMSLIKDDGNSNDNDNDLIGWLMKSNRAVRAAPTNSLMLSKFFDVVCKMTTWNFQI